MISPPSRRGMRTRWAGGVIGSPAARSSLPGPLGRCPRREFPLRWLCPDRTPLRPGGEWRRSDALRRAQCRCRCSWCWSVGRCRGVGRRSPECGQQHAALEHEPLGEGCLGQPGEEALQDVKLDQLVDRAPVLAGLPAQVEIGLSGDSSAGRRCHSSTARAWRRAGSACGNHRASSVSRAWLAPDRLSQRRRACHARSLPSRCRSRMASMMERSAV